VTAAEHKPVTLAVSAGDPRGIGPEILAKALCSGQLPSGIRLLAVVPAGVLRREAERLGLLCLENPDAHTVVDTSDFTADHVEPREPSAESGRAALACIERAVALVQSGEADALVTGPISKEAIAAAGSPFPGHTEMLAHLTGGGRPVMMLVNGPLRVAMVTTHMALREVPDAVTAEAIVATAQIVDDGLRRYFGVGAPRLAVCGLNPHAGDGGRFGDEEALVISPAVATARQAGIDLVGPCPADSVFLQAVAGRYDAVLPLYHDQGMVPVKMAGLGSVVNVTLGLPIIRTSVGHGTAFDIAGTGKADPSSLLAAIDLAAAMVRADRAVSG
jgi:4-hydroxythreonine-4-phosphate dehydrogenase